jgi:Fic family protein
MSWNWQQAGWPNFTWDAARLMQPEAAFAEGAGVLVGAARHLADPDRQVLTIDLMSTEAVDTSAIEGERLDRESVQSSIRRQFGLAVDARTAGPAEVGMAELMVALYRSVGERLDHDTLFAWHRMVMRGRTLGVIGRYRAHFEAMQIVSGSPSFPRVHFEAPPSDRVRAEMDRFLAWFEETRGGGIRPFMALTRAGLAHLWFESVHPFEDGNGRIGRAISEKALAQGPSSPVLTAIAGTLLRHRKDYYAALEAGSRTLDATAWLLWFADAVLEAQRRALVQLEFVLHKAKLLDRVRGRLNARQEKVVLRLFAAGPNGFIGGLSAGNYMSISGARPATATRDLAKLVSLGVLRRSGDRKATRYHLNVPAPGERLV